MRPQLQRAALPRGLELPPGVEPREYQLEAVDLAREHVRRGRRPLIVAPTGSGKTTVGALVAASAVARGSGVLWVAHRRELVHQAQERLQAFGLEVGLVLAGEPPVPSAPVQVASIATLRRRELPPAAVVVVDEAHRGRASTYERLLAHYGGGGAAILGLTATPQRGDGRGLAPVFDALVETVTAGELRAAGILVPARVFAPDVPELAGLAVRAGDFDEGQAAERMSGLTGSIAAHWQRLAAGQRTLVFCCTVEHSRAIRDELLAVGVPAEHLDGSTPTRERDAILARLRSGETLVVCNVGVCVEGLDIPSLEAVVLARPTRSVTLFLQAVGRGLRAAPRKRDCIVLDHAGNALRLGHPEEERTWDLHGRPERGKRELRSGARCPDCARVRAPGERACRCGREWPAAVLARAPEHRDGTLAELRPRRRRTRTARGPLEERERVYRRLVRRARRRGYLIGWARHRYRERFGDWPRGLEHVEALYRAAPACT